MNRFQALTRALERDLKLAGRIDSYLRRAHALNIDSRNKARSRLDTRVALLLPSLIREIVLLCHLVPVDHDAFTAIYPLLNRAIKDTAAFRSALSTAVLLDPEREPELDALIAVKWLLAESITIASTHTELPTRRTALPASQLIARVGARLLPWEERQRYLDEYLSELDELAQDSSRRAQLAHALRLLVRAPALRMALRQSRLYVYRETR